MGAYTSSLVFGGFVGRVGTALVADVWGWRLALSLLALPTALGALTMWRWLPRDRPAHSGRRLGGVVASHLRNRRLLTNALCAATVFFGFVGIFTYGTYRLTSPEIGLGLAGAGLVYGVWLVGIAVPRGGRPGATAGPAAAAAGPGCDVAGRLPADAGRLAAGGGGGAGADGLRDVLDRAPPASC